MLNIGTTVSLLLPSDALWRGASYYLESPSLLAVMGAAGGGIPFFASAPPTTAMLAWSVGYVVVVLGGALLAFRHAISEFRAVDSPVDKWRPGCG